LSVPAWREELDAREREALERTAMPKWTEPMLATLTHDYFSDPDWIFEPKLDGERCLAFRDGRGARLLSRNQERLDDAYPELVDALARAGNGRWIVDGEVVALADGISSFSRLQQRIGIRDPDEARASGIKVYLYLFDILHLDGYDLTRLGLRRRKQLLKKALRFCGPLRYTAHRNEHGKDYRDEACRKGWEGVIAKAAGSRYVHGRSRHWLKFKCGNRQELVIGGYTEPCGSRQGFGALLVGYQEEGKLRYAGRVGTGFDDETLRSLRDRMDRLEREQCPFEAGGHIPEKGVHWIRPRLVAEIGFTEWTRDGRLRHPRFLGLREDKAAGEVVRESPGESR